MSELEDTIKALVVPLCEKAVQQQDNERYDGSNRSLQKVLDLIPEPKHEWKAYSWLQLSRADNYYELKQYTEALELISDTLTRDNSSQSNPYVMMRYGQCLFEINKKTEAKDALKKALELGGEEIFEDEYVKYLKFIKE